MNRKQQRFTEDSTEVEKKRKTQAREMVPPPSGPNSLSPGCWLIEANVSTRGTQSEARDTVLAIVDSYKPGARTRQTRVPVSGQGWESEQAAETFIDLGQDLETRSSCYAVAPPFGCRSFSFQFPDTLGISPQSDAIAFPMIDQPNVLSGAALMDYRASVQKDFPDFYKAKPKKKRKARASALILRRVPMSLVVERFQTWHACPSEDSERLFWEDLHALLRKRVQADLSADGKKLRLHDRAEEFLNDFLLYLSGLLRRKQAEGKSIDSFEHYLNRAWKFRRMDALKEVTEYERFHPSSNLKRADSSEEDSDEANVSLNDQRDYALDKMHDREAEPVPPSEAEVVERWQAKLALLDPTLADLVGYKLAGLTDSEAGKRMRLSRQAVVRLKGRIRAEVTA